MHFSGKKLHLELKLRGRFYFLLVERGLTGSSLDTEWEGWQHSPCHFWAAICCRSRKQKLRYLPSNLVEVSTIDSILSLSFSEYSNIPYMIYSCSFYSCMFSRWIFLLSQVPIPCHSVPQSSWTSWQGFPLWQTRVDTKCSVLFIWGVSQSKSCC